MRGLLLLLLLLLSPAVKKKMRGCSSLAVNLFVVFLASAQVGPVYGQYDCTSDADCQYEGCDDTSY